MLDVIGMCCSVSFITMMLDHVIKNDLQIKNFLYLFMSKKYQSLYIISTAGNTKIIDPENIDNINMHS
jgi:hypothetical protein